MSYTAMSNDELLAHGSNEASILYDAIYHVTRNGEDVRVINDRGEDVWFVEADTKVDDEVPTFPAIVHDHSDIAAMREP